MQEENWNKERKADNSPLTRADQEANTLICAGLAALAPHIPIVSEENKAVGYEIRKVRAFSYRVLLRANYSEHRRENDSPHLPPHPKLIFLSVSPSLTCYQPFPLSS